MADQVYTGFHPHSIDAQRRVAIPREWRKDAGDDAVFYLLPGRNQTIQVLPKELFEQEILDKVRKVSFANAEKSQALAMIGAKASRSSCDKQGRITMTQELMEHAVGTRAAWTPRTSSTRSNEFRKAESCDVQ